MPTNRLKVMRTRTRGNDGLSDAALSYFWWAGTISNKWAEDRTEDEIFAFWKQHRGEILDWYIEKNRLQKGEPGKRPSFFWNEIDEPRRKVGKLSYSKPCTKDGPDTTEYFEDVFESDYDFLKRLDLLQGWEKAAKRPAEYYDKLEEFHPLKGQKKCQQTEQE